MRGPRRLALLGVLAVAGCSSAAHKAGRATATPTEGSEMATENRPVGPFTRLVVDAGADVSVRLGRPESVTVTAMSGVAAKIATTVSDGTLTVAARQSYSTRRPVVVDVTAPRLDRVVLGGSGRVALDGVNGPSLLVELTGSGDVRAAGAVDELTVDLSGTGAAHLYGVEAARVRARLGGAGAVEVTATTALDAGVSGAGEVRYRGQPSTVSTSVTGAGRIRPG